MQRLAVLTLILPATLLAACSSKSAETGLGEGPGNIVSVAGGTYQDVSFPELQSMIETKDFPLINVHIPFEGDLPDTDLSILFDEIEDHLDLLPADKDARIVLYCRSGRMSSIAAEPLVGLGYIGVYNLERGFNAWQGAGLPPVNR